MKALRVALGVCCVVAVSSPPAARANPIGIGAGDTARVLGAQLTAAGPNDVETMTAPAGESFGANGRSGTDQSIEVLVDDHAASAAIRLDELGVPPVFVFRQDGRDAIQSNHGHHEHGGPPTTFVNTGDNGVVVTTPAAGSQLPTVDPSQLPQTLGDAISAIPEPAPLPLLAAAVAGLFLYRRRLSA
jgi:hypothetical protein